MGRTFDDIVDGLDEMRRHLAGEDTGAVVHVPAVDVVELRRRTGLSQAQFSKRIGVSSATLKNWEQGRRTPQGPAAVLLALIDRDPQIVERHLGDLKV